MQPLSGLEQQVYFQLEATDTFVVKASEIAHLLGIPLAYARQVAHRMVKKQAFEQVKPGLYARIPASILIDKGQYGADPILIASQLTFPYFLSFYTAFSLHGLAQRPLQTIYFTSFQLVRPFRYRDFAFQPVKVIQKRFFGHERIEYRGQKVWASDVERTVLDAIDRPHWCGGWQEVMLCLSDVQELEWERLLSYVDQFNARALVHRLGYLLSYLKTPQAPAPFLDALKRRKSTSIFYFQTWTERSERHGQRGKLVKEWNLIVDPELEKELANVG